MQCGRQNLSAVVPPVGSHRPKHEVPQKKSQCEQEVAESRSGQDEEVPVPADPDEDANVGVQRLKARGVDRKHPFEGGKTSSGMLCRRCVTINGAGSQSLVGRQTSGTPRCFGQGRHGVRRHNHWIDLKGTCQDGKFFRAPICSVQHGPMRRVVSRYGLRGGHWGKRPIQALHRDCGRKSSSIQIPGDVSRDTRVSQIWLFRLF